MDSWSLIRKFGAALVALIGAGALASLPVNPGAWAAPPKSGASSHLSSSKSSIPAGYESYSSRPDILTLEPKAHPNLGADWEKVKRGHLEAIAMLMETYPDREIYFLARDSELLYDFARYVSRGDPKHQARFHLLNVSRANMRDPHLEDYLAQEGISEEAIKAGKKVLFVDTGFSGTIPRVIAESFPPKLRAQFQTQLMSSSNPDHPSSRAFLTSVNPAAPELDPGSLHGSIVSYEHMPRYTDRSDRYVKLNGKWEPLSPLGVSTDGSVSKKKARAYMEDLLAYSNKKESQTLLSTRRSQWKNLKELSGSPKLSHKKLVTELKAMLLTAKNAKDPFIEAVIRDFLELRSTNLPGGPPEVKLRELGLTAPAIKGSGSNKNALIQKYPEWASVLENPDSGISNLINANEWGKLGAITDTVQDEEFRMILAIKLGDQPPTSGHKQFLKTLIEKGDKNTLHLLAEATFSQPHTAGMEDMIRLLIEKGDQDTHLMLAASTFSEPHTAEMKDLIRLLIEKGDQETLRRLARDTFSQPHTVKMKDLIRLLIEKGDQETLRALAEYTFSKPHTARMRDLMRLLIEKGDQATLTALKVHAFAGKRKWNWNRPNCARLKEALSIANPAKRQAFLEKHLGPDPRQTTSCVKKALKGILIKK